MSTNKKYSVLVIGSEEHACASKCIKWGELVYVGDYDALIINTTSLNKETIRKIISQNADYFYALKKDIKDVQEKKGIKITCIISPYIFNSEVSGDDINEILTESINNYSWSPVIPIFEKIPKGEKINIDTSKLPEEYLKKIKCYELLYNGSVNATGYTNKSKDGSVYTKLHMYSLLDNIVGREVAFAIKWKVHEYSDYTVLTSSKFSIEFVPPTENVYEGINIIISDLCKTEEENPPEWIEKIMMPGEENIKTEIENRFGLIKNINREIQEHEKQLHELYFYKKLLYTQGLELEDVVEKSFALLDIKLESPIEHNKEDRFFRTSDNKKIYVEIRGVNRLMNESDLTQLIKRIAEKPSSTQYKTRGIFIFNHQNKSQPNERAEAFHHNIEKQAVPYNIGLIDTISLFEIVKQKLSNKEIKKFDVNIFNTIGIFKASQHNTELKH